MIPLTTNNTADIYRNGSGTPASTGNKIYFKPDYVMGSEHNEGDVANKWTHIALFDISADVRDGSTGSGTFSSTAWDTVYIPQKAGTGTGYRVVFVERVNRGTPTDHLRVYLRFGNVTWPTNEV